MHLHQAGTLLITLAGLMSCARPAQVGQARITSVNVRITDGLARRPERSACAWSATPSTRWEQSPRPNGTRSSTVTGRFSPGFIDTHSHDASGLQTTPDALAAVSQGITTIIAGHDGGHPMPLAATMDSLTKSRGASNVGFYAGRGTIRAAVLGDSFRRIATVNEVN